jgi:hypothetical protein
MSATVVCQWVLGLSQLVLRLSQAKTLAWIVSGSLQVRQFSLANLAAELLAETSYKHKLKRLDRFLSNDRIQPAKAYKPFLQKLLRKRKKRLIAALDWTQFGSLHTLALVAVFKGRAIPLFWTTVSQAGLYKQQTWREKELLTAFKDGLPKGLKVVLLADRGFGKTDLARHCQELHLDYLIRIQPNVQIRCKQHTGLLKTYGVQPGQCHVLREAQFRKRHPVCQQVIVCHRRRKQAEVWYLMSSLQAAATRLVTLYSKRMTIEESFRDQKSHGHGFCLGDTLIHTPERLDRFLLVLAIVYLLLCGLGLHAKAEYSPACWSSNKREQDQSVLSIARRMLKLLQLPPEQAVEALRSALTDIVPKWG